MSDTAVPPSPALDKYRRLTEGASLADRTGYGRLGSQLTRRADRFARRHSDLDVSGVQPLNFDDWSSLGTSSHDAVETVAQQMARRARARGGDFDRTANRGRVMLNDEVGSLMQQGAQKELSPSLDMAQERADELAGTAAVSAGDEQAMRSRLAAMVRSAESTRMARIGASLGFGNMASSPAAAALAAQSAEDADHMIVSSTRDLGLQVNEMNRAQARQDIDLATRVTMARHALQTGSPATLVSMQKDVASIIDAMYSRDWSMDVAEKQMAEAGKQSLNERLGGWLSTAKGVASLAAGAYTGGASLAAEGAMGSGTGYGEGSGQTRYGNSYSDQMNQSWGASHQGY